MKIIYLAITAVNLLFATLTLRSNRKSAIKYRNAVADKIVIPAEQPEVPKEQAERADLMKQYELMVEVYKFHFEMVLKFLIFYCAITGAILSFYLSQPNTGLFRFALVFPIFLSIVFCIFAFLGASHVGPMKDHMVRVTDRLHLEPFPNVDLLKRLEQMLKVAGVLTVLIAIGLIVVSWARPAQPNNGMHPTANSVTLIENLPLITVHRGG